MTTFPPFRSLTALLLLGGCVTAIVEPNPPPGPFPNASDVSLGSSATPILNDEATATTPDVYKFTLPAELADTNALLYAEVVGAVGTAPDALSVTLYDSAGEALLTSSSPDFFESAELPTPARTVTSTVTPQAIRVAPVCRGPCVLERLPQTPGQEDVVYLEVEATQNVPYALYLYTDVFADTGETANDNRNTAVVVTGSETGALETLGDSDFYRSSTAATQVRLESSAAALSLRAEIFLEDGTPAGFAAVGQPYSSTLAPNRFLVRVYADTPRAAVAGRSTYALTFE